MADDKISSNPRLLLDFQQLKVFLIIFLKEHVPVNLFSRYS